MATLGGDAAPIAGGAATAGVVVDSATATGAVGFAEAGAALVGAGELGTLVEADCAVTVSNGAGAGMTGVEA